MKYAVIVSGSKQYRVSEGDVIEVDLLPVTVEEMYSFSEVLLVVDGKDTHIGYPVVQNFPVTAKVLSHTKGKKIRVARFRAKSRYRKVKGFRAQSTKVQIKSIGIAVDREKGMNNNDSKKTSSEKKAA